MPFLPLLLSLLLAPISFSHLRLRLFKVATGSGPGAASVFQKLPVR